MMLVRGAEGVPQRDQWLLKRQPVQGTYTFVLARGSLFTKAWTNSSGPMCLRRSCVGRERRSQKPEVMGAWHSAPAGYCLLGHPQRVSGHLPVSLGLCNPVLGCHRSQDHPSFPMFRGCLSTWGAARRERRSEGGSNVPIESACGVIPRKRGWKLGN